MKPVAVEDEGEQGAGRAVNLVYLVGVDQQQMIGAHGLGFIFQGDFQGAGQDKDNLRIIMPVPVCITGVHVGQFNRKIRAVS